MLQNSVKKLLLIEHSRSKHTHLLQSKVDFSFYRVNEGISITLKDKGIITHDEHDKIVLDPGCYRSYQQVEYNPLDQTVNPVYD